MPKIPPIPPSCTDRKETMAKLNEWLDNGKPANDFPKGGVLNGWTGKFSFTPSDGSPVRWIDLLIEHAPNLPPNSIVFKESVLNGWKDRFPDFGEWAKEELKPEPKPKSFKDKILDSLNFRFESESELKPIKMGKKKKLAEIERLKQVVEMLEEEKDEILDKQLKFDLETVKGILSRHGKVDVTANFKKPEYFSDLNSKRTIVITLNC